MALHVHLYDTTKKVKQRISVIIHIHTSFAEIIRWYKIWYDAKLKVPEISVGAQAMMMTKTTTVLAVVEITATKIRRRAYVRTYKPTEETKREIV